MANKFRFSFKLTGLEMEVEGTQEQVATITNNLSNQLKALSRPMTISEGLTDDVEAEVTSSPQPAIAVPKKRKIRKTRTPVNGSDIIGSVLDFKADPTKYGTPASKWTTAKKAMWILFVVKEQLGADELSANQITQSFNKHFKQAKIIQINNVSRDLGKAKLANPAYVAENTAKSPSLWYLTDEGLKYVQKSINEPRENTAH